MAFEEKIQAADAAMPEDDVGQAIGTDERRMHVRAYNYWCSLLDGRDFPSIQDLEPATLDDFGPHAVLLDFTRDRDDPGASYIGDAIREECGLDETIETISDVPPRSLLSRLTDHYMQIIANRAPVGFEAEFVNQRGHEICYRGILMPLSSDGITIDFIYGVINWKDTGEQVAADATIAPALAPIEPDPVPDTAPGVDELPNSDDTHMAWQDGPLADGDLAEETDAPGAVLTESDGLADWLFAARDSAEVCKAAEGRSRAALYDALSLAYDFSLAAQRRPDDYAEILDDAGVKTQARAPMTPIIKLVFGADYNKSRITEFSTALAYAHRTEIGFGQFKEVVEKTDGGIKGFVKAERAARRGDKPAVDKAAKARDKLRHAQPLESTGFEGEYALLVARRNADGSIDVVAEVDDTKLVDRVLVKAAS
ncbi:MAG: hypothetical protein HKO13_00135 [Sphingomonas sp.]|nr:hypothetical protein [Sphingomonas sp.]